MKHTVCFLVLFLYVDAADTSCKVADFAVQENLDLKKFTGVTWYEQKLLPAPYFPLEDLYHDFQHTYYLHPDGATLTLFINGQEPVNHTCKYFKQHLKTTETPGKMLCRHFNNTLPFYVDHWIVSTDYTHYSVIYRCEEQDSAGECILPIAAVFSRTPQLSSEKMTIADSFLDKLCINKSTMIVINHTNECHVNKECAIYTIERQKRMQNFNFDGFAGAWYRVSWVPEPHTPVNASYHDYQYNFAPDSDRTLFTVFTRARKPADIENCIYSQGQLLLTSENGKFSYRRMNHNNHVLTTDFWVMDADDLYEKYAIVYGCEQTDESGLCIDFDAYILSRNTTIPDDMKTLIENKIQSLCLNSSDFLPTVQDDQCSDARSCQVESIEQRMVQDFDHQKVKGIWYRYSYLSSTPQIQFTDYQKLVTTPDDPKSQTSIAKIRARYPSKHNSCEYEDLVVSTTGQPGKQITIYKTTSGDKEVTSYIMATNYSSYLVEYICEETDHQSMCSEPSVSIWSRDQDLSPHHLTVINQVIVGLCLNNDSFTKVDHSNPCPEEVPSKSSSIIKDYLLMSVIMVMVVSFKTDVL